MIKDWMIEDAADAHIQAAAVVPEYAIEDYEKNLKGADVRLELRYHANVFVCVCLRPCVLDERNCSW